jgi:N-acyl-L-homoserine lactone synthetase
MYPKAIVARTEEEKNVSYQMRYKMMCQELKWLPMREYPFWIERDEYDSMQSIAFLAKDKNDNVIGTSRLILKGDILLPIERHFELYPAQKLKDILGDGSSYAEASRFIVPKHHIYKNHEITLTLISRMIQMCVERSIGSMLMSADYRFYRLLRILGLPLCQIGEPKVYLGSETIPGVLPLARLESETKYRKPKLYARLREAHLPEEMFVRQHRGGKMNETETKQIAVFKLRYPDYCEGKSDDEILLCLKFIEAGRELIRNEIEADIEVVKAFLGDMAVRVN